MKKNEFGKAALHFAAETGNFEIVRYLINQGATVDDTFNYPPSGQYYYSARRDPLIWRFR